MDTIELETDGRVVFERYPTGTLVGMADMYESTKAGICDIGLVNVPVLPDQFPLTNSLRLPGLFQNSTQASVIRQTLLEEGYIANEWKDLKVLWMGGTAPWSLSCREKQVRTMEDLKGLKIANIGEPELSFIGALGAVPVAMPNTEFYMALERGAVDGCWMDTNGQAAFGFYNVSPYLTEIPANGYGSVTWCMNKEKYNSLPPDIKAIFDRNIGILGSLLHGLRFERNTAVAISFLNEREDYPPVYILPPEEEARWLKAGEPLIEATIADLEAQGLPAEAMFERIHELVKIYETWGF